MVDAVPVALVVGGIATSLSLVTYLVVKANRLDETGKEADRRLVAAFDPEMDPRLRASAELDGVATVNEHAETGDDIVVPMVTVPLSAVDEPDMHDVWELTAKALREVHPIFSDAHVRHYDVQFEFGEANYGGLGSRTCRRMAIPPELADELLGDASYGQDDLAAAVESGDDGDDVTPPVYWGECTSYHQGDGGATAAATASTAGTM